MRKSMKATLLILFIFVTPILAVSPGFASSTRYVFVLVAYDEEFDWTARNVYWYSPVCLAEGLVTQVSWRFEELFNIKFIIITYVSWDSNDSIDNIFDLLDECITETGFHSGMTYHTITIDILVAFSDQFTGEAYGIFSPLGAVLVYEAYYWLSLGQCTDNVLQHELSHLYDCGHHNQAGLDCVMNKYKVPLNTLEGEVPYILTTENWCSDCINTINLHRERWGREIMVGPGPGFPDGPYPVPYSGREDVPFEP